MAFIDRDIDEIKDELKERFILTAKILYGRELADLSQNEVYNAVAAVVKQYTTENWIKTNKQRPPTMSVFTEGYNANEPRKKPRTK